MMTENEFRDEMVRFYKACRVPAERIDQILQENGPLIGQYLMATPELMGRKFYEKTFGKKL